MNEFNLTFTEFFNKFRDLLISEDADKPCLNYRYMDQKMMELYFCYSGYYYHVVITNDDLVKLYDSATFQIADRWRLFTEEFLEKCRNVNIEGE